MSKKAQLTIFVIIALLLVAIIAVVFIAKNNNSNLVILSQAKKEYSLVSSTISSCLDDSLKESALIVGMQGGYFILPGEYVTINLSNIAYGSFILEKTLISLDGMEEQMSEYMEIALPICMNNSTFAGFKVTFQKPKVETEITSGRVSAKARYPFTITKQEEIYNFDKTFSQKIELRLWEMYKLAENISETNIQSRGDIEWTYLIDQDFQTVIVPFSEDTSIYMIKDLEYKLYDEDYNFIFASRFE